MIFFPACVFFEAVCRADRGRRSKGLSPEAARHAAETDRSADIPL